MNTQLTKKCPYCAEEIQWEAILCKHCKMELTDYQSSVTNRSNKSPSNSNVSQSNNTGQGSKLTVGDGVRTGCGMFIVLPLLLVGGAILFILMLAAC